jgi:hypothetical protein
MKELTVQKNPMDVRSVGKPSLVHVTFVTMNEHTVKKNPMDVSNVGKFSL